MTINRPQRIILSIALLVCICSTVVLLKRYDDQQSIGLHYQCFKEAGGWGYDILTGKQILIHQTNIPGRPGNKGFVNQEQAKAIAEIVIGKIKMGKTPLITLQQLQQSGILLSQ